MAESNHRYSAPAAARGGLTPPSDQPDDPLAGLTLLIDQSAPMNDLARDARYPAPAGSRSARKFNSLAQHGYAAPDDVFQETSEEQSSTREQSSYDLHSPNDTRDDRRYELLPLADARQSRSASYEHELLSHPNPADLHLEAPDTPYDEYEDQAHDHPDDHAYEEDPNLRRQSGFISVATVFGLALLGTAGAFAYRGPFADSVVPSLLSIIKAEGGANKIIPTNTASQTSVSPQADADNAGSSERLLPGEERRVDVPPPVSTAPRPVSSGPIFADLAPAAGTGTASVFPPSPLAQPAATARVDSLNSPTTAPAPAIPSANQAVTPAARSPRPGSLTTPGPKKIGTVSMPKDQPNAVDSAASQSPRVAVRTTAQGAKSSGANEPLSIVPSSNDAERAAAGSARTPPPARSEPVGKPAETKIASTSPAASGGGYGVQVLSQHNEKEVQLAFRALQAKYPKLLGEREPMVRRADLGAKGVYYRAMVGPFVSAEQANELCSNLKAAGGSCIVQKN